MLGLKAFLAVNVAVFALVGWNFVGEYMRGRELRLEIAAMERRAAELETKNFQIAELGKKLAQGEMIEREARIKLNLQKPGEEVVIVRGADKTSVGTAARTKIVTGLAVSEGTINRTSPPRSNPEKWMSYFFAAQEGHE